MKSHIENIKDIKKGCDKAMFTKAEALFADNLNCGEEILKVKNKPTIYAFCKLCQSKLERYLMAMKTTKIDFVDSKGKLISFKDCEQAIKEGEK